MKKIKQFIINWFWQLPQNLIGLLLVKATKAEKRVMSTVLHGNIEWWKFKRDTRFRKFISGVSLGKYILLPYEDIETVKHEYGHSKQSEYLGWLYLPVIGIWSAVFCNLWSRWFHKDWTAEERTKWYYTRWCETWADKLGGVVRVYE